MSISDEQLKNWFTYHAPRDVKTMGDYAAIRGAGLELATQIVACTPEGPDQTAAIRKVREAVMTANAAIATQVKH
jgi:hypothetical protein